MREFVEAAGPLLLVVWFVSQAFLILGALNRSLLKVILTAGILLLELSTAWYYGLMDWPWNGLIYYGLVLFAATVCWAQSVRINNWIGRVSSAEISKSQSHQD